MIGSPFVPRRNNAVVWHKTLHMFTAGPACGRRCQKGALSGPVKPLVTLLLAVKVPGRLASTPTTVHSARVCGAYCRKCVLRCAKLRSACCIDTRRDPPIRCAYNRFACHSGVHKNPILPDPNQAWVLGVGKGSAHCPCGFHQDNSRSLPLAVKCACCTALCAPPPRTPCKLCAGSGARTPPPPPTHPHAPEVLAQVRPPTATRAGTRGSSTARQGCSFLSFSSWRLRRPLGALDPCGPPSLILFYPPQHTHTRFYLDRHQKAPTHLEGQTHGAHTQDRHEPVVLLLSEQSVSNGCVWIGALSNAGFPIRAGRTKWSVTRRRLGIEAAVVTHVTEELATPTQCPLPMRVELCLASPLPPMVPVRRRGLWRGRGGGGGGGA